MTTCSQAARDRLNAFVATYRHEDAAFLADYRALRTELRCPTEPHHPRAIASARRLLQPTGRFRQRDLRALLGGDPQSVRHAQRVIHDDSARALDQRLVSDLGALPATCLDAALGAQFTRPPGEYCGRVLALREPRLRLTAALSLYVAAAGRVPGHRVTQELKGWESFDRWTAHSARALELTDPRQVPDAVLQWLTDDPTQCRFEAWRDLATAGRRVSDYVARQPALAARLAGRLLSIPLPGHYHVPRTVAAAARDAAAARRAVTAAPLADRLPEIIALADLRFTEVAAIRDAFDTACGRADPNGTCFAVTLARTRWDGCPLPGTRTLDFTVLSAAELEARFGAVGACKPWRSPETLHLVFTGVRDQVDNDDCPPVLEAYRRGLFVAPGARDAAQERALAVFIAAVGRVPKLDHLDPFRYPSGHDRRLADRAFAAGAVLVPIAVLHHGLAVGRAAALTELISGARVGETLQQCWSADRVGYTADWQFYFLARPKGSEDLKRFYIDERTLLSITAVTAVASRNEDPPLMIRRPRSKEPQPQRYVYQRHGRALPQNQINAALQIMLLGFPLTSHDLRHAFARFCKDKGIPERHIQSALNHAFPATTRRYTPPTDQMKADLAQQLAGRLAAGGPFVDPPR